MASTAGKTVAEPSAYSATRCASVIGGPWRRSSPPGCTQDYDWSMDGSIRGSAAPHNAPVSGHEAPSDRVTAGDRVTAVDRELDDLLALVGAVPDPEIPVLSLADLGIVRGIERIDGRVMVTLTPTYSGCPATDVISADVRERLRQAGQADAEIRLTLAPPWSTDWISADGRRKLREYGIAPPAGEAEAGTGVGAGAGSVRLYRWSAQSIECPNCGSTDTEQLSAYGSTPCKALHRCRACREPFDYFKVI